MTNLALSADACGDEFLDLIQRMRLHALSLLLRYREKPWSGITDLMALTALALFAGLYS